MLFEHAVSISMPCFWVPSELEDVYSLEQIENDKDFESSEKVLQALKSINESVVISRDLEDARFLGQHGFNVVSSSLAIIKDNTKLNPKYIKSVFNFFLLQSLINYKF